MEELKKRITALEKALESYVDAYNRNVRKANAASDKTDDCADRIKSLEKALTEMGKVVTATPLSEEYTAQIKMMGQKGRHVDNG